jgi:adenosylcobinamide kinase/adenosylcobinamide-phosphate guanylyltransferase
VAFVLGGARSGKSRFAEIMARETGLDRHYVATGRAFDDEMGQRIATHQADRGHDWTTHEVIVDLAGALAELDGPSRVVVVDCLTLWVTNLMMEQADMTAAADALVARLSCCTAHVILVSNEVGLGIVPENQMAREFRDHAGRLHQKVAAIADQVFFMAAGLSLKMKG